jgi:hypothetical protein
MEQLERTFIVVGMVNLGSTLLKSGGCGSLSITEVGRSQMVSLFFSGCMSGQCSERSS